MIIEKEARRASGVGSARMPNIFGRLSMLLEEEKDKGGGGGGAAALSQAAVDQINGIVKAHLQRVDFGAMIAPAIQKAVGDLMPDVVKNVAGEVTKAIGTPAAGAGDKGGKPGEKPGAGLSEEWQNKFAQLTATVDQLSGKVKEKDDALKVAHQRERDATFDGKLKTSLGKVKPELLAGAMGVVKAKAEVKWNDQGEPVVKVKREARGVGAYVEEVSVEKYASEWLDSDEGKGYLPAPAGRGSGVGSRPNAGAGGGTPQFAAGGGGQGQGQGAPQGRPVQGVSDQELGNMVLAAYSGGGDE